MRITPDRRAVDALPMQIYSALLGNAPRIDRAPATGKPRLTMRVRVEARIEHHGSSPFRKPTLRERVERCAGYAVLALDEARDRLTAARQPPAVPATEATDAATPIVPVILIGPAAASATRRKSQASHAHAA